MEGKALTPAGRAQGVGGQQRLPLSGGMEDAKALLDSQTAGLNHPRAPGSPRPGLPPTCGSGHLSFCWLLVTPA